VRITAEGTRLLERAKAAAETVEDRAVAQLSAEEHDQLSSLIQRVMETLAIRVTERS
jgi:DNA-binding MarR family transcriptional regulator